MADKLMETKWTKPKKEKDDLSAVDETVPEMPWLPWSPNTFTQVQTRKVDNFSIFRFWANLLMKCKLSPGISEISFMICC